MAFYSCFGLRVYEYRNLEATLRSNLAVLAGDATFYPDLLEANRFFSFIFACIHKKGILFHLCSSDLRVSNVCMCVCMFVFVYVCVGVCLDLCLSVRLRVSAMVCLHTYVVVYM